MRKKLDTRFPAARIKKIMQTDEDVGKIALAVPLLVSKALELFLQDLCDRSYEITLEKGAKTMNSLHLKQCVHRFSMFDFLKDTVSKVPDLSVSEASGEDRSATKRRKVVDDEETDSDEELKKSKLHDSGHNTSGGVRGRGRGRGRGRPRGSGRTQERVKFEDDSDMSKHNEDGDQSFRRIQENHSEATVLRNFDLNVDLNEIRDSPPPLLPAVADPPPPVPAPAADPAPAPAPAPALGPQELNQEEYPGWSLAEIENMAIDPLRLVGLNRTIEEDEDYDEEEG